MGFIFKKIKKQKNFLLIILIIYVYNKKGNNIMKKEDLENLTNNINTKLRRRKRWFNCG